jgi:hypothetical protein
MKHIIFIVAGILILYSCKKKADECYVCYGWSQDSSSPRAAFDTSHYCGYAADEVWRYEKSGKDTVFSSFDHSDWLVNYYHCVKQ